MNEVEVTMEVKETLDQVLEKLKKEGFNLNKTALVDDTYLCHNSISINKDNIDFVLKNCVLLRFLKDSGVEYKKITYKNKIVENGVVVSEEKVNINCEDLEKANKLFSYLKFNKVVRVKYDVYEFQKGNFKFALQDVEGLGLLLEHEGTENYDNLSVEELKNKKNELANKVRAIGLKFGTNNDIKKAYELIKRNTKCL